VRLLLARHGQSTWNSLRRFQGIADVPLSDIGRAQARALRDAVRRHRITRAYVSPLRRAVETAELALAGTDIEIVPVPDLRELSLGAWEGCTVTEIRAQEGDPYRAWLRAPVDCPPPEGEALDDVCTRMLGVVERIEAAHGPDDDVLIVAHGGVISVYACHLLGCSFNSLWRLRVDNASLTVVAPPRVVTLNDTNHLPGDLRPTHLQRLEIVTGPEATTAGRAADGSPAP
jgi:broad specificity phosphatase PhoE